jgi:predicted thioesterase
MFIRPIISPTVKKPMTSAAVTPARAICLGLALRIEARIDEGDGRVLRAAGLVMKGWK